MEPVMHEVIGNTDGLKNNIIEALQQLYEYKAPPWQLVSPELAVEMSKITTAVNREANIFLDRKGNVLSVSIGDSNTVSLPDLPGRRGSGRLSGIRCIHTHPGGNSQLSGIDLSALRAHKYDLMAAIGVNDEKPEEFVLNFAIITGKDDYGQYTVQEYGALKADVLDTLFLPNVISSAEKLLAVTDDNQKLEQRPERTMLVSLEYGKQDRQWTSEDSLEELRQLAETAGADVKAKFLQKRPKPDPGFFIGRGKVRDLALFAQQEDIDLCIFDEELSPAQQRNLEQALGIKVIDRTALILDIFAQRAQTNEGKLQVELAQLQYTLPRIMGQGLSLSRLGGGIGTRGPGETKLETDRRIIRDRIAYIKGCIDKVQNVRKLHRSRRNKNQAPSVSLVGYTNAGKSTLLNVLTHSDVYEKDQLFATLDPTTRQLDLPDKRQAILTDTVGFIQRLPHQLIAAFKSTLEETLDADLLVHVIDVSHPLYKEQSEAVYRVLHEVGAQDKPVLSVFNKIDKLPEDSGLLEQLRAVPESVCISAKKQIGLDTLLEIIANHLKLKSAEVTLLIPYSDSGMAAKLFESGTVLAQDYAPEGIKMTVRMQTAEISRWEKFIVEGDL
ncbi:MAG: GTPase HflX [Acidaminococcaceae bacterium]|nr:GTPase HflX [Acidaminococcaceae bacterium]